MQNLYTTLEASKETGIPESTIRSWLRRCPDVFQVDVHVVIEETGRKLWTEAGVQLLRSRNASEPATEPDAEIDAGNFLELLLERDSKELAQEYWRQLPARVLFRIKQMRDNPTKEEKELVRSSFRAAVTAGTSHLLMPTYQPMLLEGDGEE